MKLKLPTTVAILVSGIVFSSAVYAQKNYRTSNDYSDGVTIYEHCDFKGKSLTLRPGEYDSLRDIGFGNDSLSSIRVPRGSEAVIYQDDDYRGAYARIDKDIRCFDRKWNDQASSISVREVAYGGAANRRGGNNRYDNQAYGEPEYNNRDNRNRRINNDQRHSQANVNAKNVSQVVFDGTSLQQVSTQEWVLNQARGGSREFQEIRRDSDSVFLENKYTGERVRIDLFANDVTLVSRDGRKQRYNIDRKNAALNSSPSVVKPVVSNSPDTHIGSNCFDYKAYTRGGNGGLRFAGKPGFHRFNGKSTNTGRICHKGSLVMELGKTDLKTDVIVEINGRPFRFLANEKEYRLQNNWYRKNLTLEVGK